MLNIAPGMEAVTLFHHKTINMRVLIYSLIFFSLARISHQINIIEHTSVYLGVTCKQLQKYMFSVLPYDCAQLLQKTSKMLFRDTIVTNGLFCCCYISKHHHKMKKEVILNS